jgi:hypothetical protein
VPLQGFLEEFQYGLLVARLRHKAFEHLTFVIDGPPKIVPLAVDPLEHLVKMPAPAARSQPSTRRLRISNANKGPNLCHQNRTVS